MFRKILYRNQSTHLLKLRSENRAVCELMWKTAVEPERARMKIIPMRFACWITKAADMHSEYVILIALPRQKWLSERTPILRIT
jgi:hypothetical protein